jgi:large subunit ribosomal protein L7A
MLARIRDEAKVAGSRQLMRALMKDEISLAYIALDADPFIVGPVRELCREKGVPVTDAPTMLELGEACGLRVKTAAAGIKNKTL